MFVVKRNGNKEEFNSSKVKNAIRSAFKALDYDVEESVLDNITKDVEIWDNINVEDIQDEIIEVLRDYDFDAVAEEYLAYRREHDAIRKSQEEHDNAVKQILNATNVQNQNANVDEHSFGGREGEVQRMDMKEYALKNCMSKMARKNHERNEIYIHDLDKYASRMHNCLTEPIDDLLDKGFKTRQCNVRPAGSISTAFQLLAVTFQLQSLQQFGGVSASHLDWSMVPYYRMSFFKHLCDGINYIENLPVSFNLTREEKKNTSINDPKYTKHKIAWKYAKNLTDRELSQAVEGMYHNLNTLQSRSGNQLPFTSINYGTCTLDEGREIIRALLLGSIKGVGDKLSPNSDPEFGRTYSTPIFPCGIFQYMKGVNDKPGTPNYDLYTLALKSTSRRLYPNYVNVDWSVNKGYDRNDPRTYVSTMGCRTYNGADINAEPGNNLQLKDGRGNICPTTIILPTLAMEVKDITKENGGELVENFMNLLDRKIHEAKDMLIERFNYICSGDASAAKFMYKNGTMYGYKPEEGIRSALKHGTLALGQLGLAECLQILINCDHTTDKGMKLAKRIEGLFNSRCKEFKNNYKLNFGVYYTPAENLCYTAFKKFKERYGDIEGVTYIINKDGKRWNKEFFTNSIHVPVYKEVTPFEKIDIESQLTGYSNAGCITYVELDSSVSSNIEALRTIVDYAMEHDIPYFAINIPADRCQDCGYQGEITDKCPNCGSSNVQYLRRVTGYLTGNYRTSFNKGKQNEVEHRVKHIKTIV